MVAAVLGPTTDLVALGHHAAQLLPPYAIPLFLRVLPQCVHRRFACAIKGGWG